MTIFSITRTFRERERERGRESETETDRQTERQTETETETERVVIRDIRDRDRKSCYKGYFFYSIALSPT